MTDDAIVVEGLEKSYGSVRALRGVDFAARTGSVLGLLGPNGAGKTTTMRMAATVLAPSGGELRLLGRDPRNAGARTEIRRRLGYMPQEPGFYRSFTAFEFVDYVAILKEMTDRRARHDEVRRVLELVDLADVMQRKIKALSGGMRRRVALAQALLGDPRLLVLDEPTVGLDPVLRRDLWALFHRIADAGASVFVSSHVMDEAERCDRLMLMREGRIIADGTPGEIREKTGSDEIEAAFLAIVAEDMS